MGSLERLPTCLAFCYCRPLPVRVSEQVRWKVTRYILECDSGSYRPATESIEKRDELRGMFDFLTTCEADNEPLWYLHNNWRLRSPVLSMCSVYCERAPLKRMSVSHARFSTCNSHSENDQESNVDAEDSQWCIWRPRRRNCVQMTGAHIQLQRGLDFETTLYLVANKSFLQCSSNSRK